MSKYDFSKEEFFAVQLAMLKSDERDYPDDAYQEWIQEQMDRYEMTNWEEDYQERYNDFK